MRLFGLLGGAALLAALPFAAAHADITGEKLLEACSSRQATPLAACDGYLGGMADTLAITRQKHPEAIEICFPASVSIAQLRAIAVRELNAHPEIRQLPAAELLNRVLTRDFPCKH